MLYNCQIVPEPMGAQCSVKQQWFTVHWLTRTYNNCLDYSTLGTANLCEDTYLYQWFVLCCVGMLLVVVFNVLWQQ